MILRPIVLLLAFVCAVMTPSVSSLRAQDQQLTATSKQELARSKFKELTERMKTLMTQLQKTEPEDSKLVAAGITFVQEKKMPAQLDKAGRMLEQERWDEALVVMGSLKDDMQRLLNLLQNRDDELRKLLEQIKKLEAFKDRVDQLAKEQGEEKEDSARTEELQKHLADIEAKKKAAEALLAQQKQLREKTNELGVQAAAESTKPLADKEAELQQDTDKLAKDLENLEKKDAELKKDAAKGGAKPEAGKPSDKPADKPSDAKDGKPSEAGKPCNCSGSAGKAAKAMGQAQQQLGDKQPESSLKDQDHAIENLQQTVEELEAMAEEARRELLKLPFEQQAKKQEQTQHATDTLSKDMEKSEQAEDADNPQPTPGKQRVQQAVPKQRAAAGKLKEYVPAKQKQQDAKEDLEAAKKELEDALAQLRQQLQDEVLRALEERFTAMLARQRELSAQTKTLDATRGNLLTANNQLPAAIAEKLNSLSGSEGELESEAADALKLLGEDGTTAVFPPMVEQLRDDLAAVSKKLAAQESGAPVQQAQREIEDLLTLLIDALRKTVELKAGGH